MGFFEGLDAESYDRKYRDRDLLHRMLVYFKPQQGRMLVVGFFTILISLASASSVLIISWGTDLVRKDPSLQNIFLVAGLGFLLGVFIWVANWIARRQATQAIAGVLLNLATSAFESSVNHDLSFYDEYSSGRIVSRITSDTQDFGQLVTIITDVAAQVIEAVILGVVLWRIDWKLTLIILAFLPVVFTFGILFRKLARKVTQQGMRAMANVNATIKETVSGIAIAKNFRQEQGIFETFNDANQTSYRVNWKRGFTLNWVFPVLNALAGSMPAG
jgi:ATP-binding cassette subfamily B protein